MQRLVQTLNPLTKSYARPERASSKSEMRTGNARPARGRHWNAAADLQAFPLRWRR